jgi:hypothetical protein
MDDETDGWKKLHEKRPLRPLLYTNVNPVPNAQVCYFKNVFYSYFVYLPFFLFLCLYLFIYSIIFFKKF